MQPCDPMNPQDEAKLVIFAMILILVMIVLLIPKIEASPSAPPPSIQEFVNACPPAGLCIVKPGVYSGPLVISSETHLVAYGATLQVPSGRDGMTIATGADGSTIEGLRVTSVGTSSVVGQGIGIRQLASRIYLSNVWVRGFGRNWVCDTRKGGNCNGSLLQRVSLYRSDLEGALIAGGNSNGITTIGLDIKDACWRAPAGSVCAGLSDAGFMGNTHIGPVIHLCASRGLPSPTKFPAWITGSDNAWTNVVTPYCEGDSAPAAPQSLTTVLGGNCNIAPRSGWLLRPGTPLTSPAKYNGPIILGDWDSRSPRLRIGFGPVPPSVSSSKDLWEPGDVWILDGPSKGACKIREVASVDAAGNVKTACFGSVQ